MTNGNGPAVLNVGRVYCDLVFSGIQKLPTLGEEIYAKDFAMRAGGGAFITAAHLRELDHQTAVAAYIQSGPFGELLLEQFRSANIDISACEMAPASWGNQLTIAMAHQNDRAFLTKRGQNAVPQKCQSSMQKNSFQHLHIGEIATLIECPQLVDWARSAGMTISLDCSWDETAMSDTNALNLISKVDVFLPNEVELEFLLRSHNISTTKHFIEIIDRCILIEKKGPEGAFAHLPNETIHATAPTVNVVDATGAGDAFNAGFISAWLRQQPTKQCLYSGNQKAIDALQSVGGIAAE